MSATNLNMFIGGQLLISKLAYRDIDESEFHFSEGTEAPLEKPVLLYFENVFLLSKWYSVNFVICINKMKMKTPVCK